MENLNINNNIQYLAKVNTIGEGEVKNSYFLRAGILGNSENYLKIDEDGYINATSKNMVVSSSIFQIQSNKIVLGQYWDKSKLPYDKIVIGNGTNSENVHDLLRYTTGDRLYIYNDISEIIFSNSTLNTPYFLINADIPNSSSFKNLFKVTNTEINVYGLPINNVLYPTANGQAANKAYVDDKKDLIYTTEAGLEAKVSVANEAVKLLYKYSDQNINNSITMNEDGSSIVVGAESNIQVSDGQISIYGKYGILLQSLASIDVIGSKIINIADISSSETDGSIAANKNYVDNSAMKLDNKITELQDQINQLKNQLANLTGGNAEANG